MPCPCPNGQKACCPQNNTFDSLTVTNGLRVLRGPTTLCGETEVEKLCFKDKSGDGQKWCAQENGATDQLCITKGNTGKQVCVLPDSGAVKTTGFFADGTEVINVTDGGPQNPSLLKGTTVLQSAGAVNGAGTLGAGTIDGQIKRISVLTPLTTYVLTIPNLIHPTLVSPLTLSGTSSSVVIYNELFDNIVPPAFPAGWTISSNTADNFRTSSSFPDSPPNYILGVGDVIDTVKNADTPSIAIPTSNERLRFSFRNWFDHLEEGFDGGQLQISINAGPFIDIITAGGKFVSGAYTGDIESGPAWTGDSNGYITSSVDLPSSVAGTSVKFRFQMTTDSSNNSTAWRIDTIVLTKLANLQSVELQWIGSLNKWSIFNFQE